MKLRVKRLLFPPACVGCGERFDVFAEEEVPVFCLRCRVAWEAAKRADCPICGKPLDACTCVPEPLRRAGCDALVKLCEYVPDRPREIGTHLILTLKDRRLSRVFTFLGGEEKRLLAPLLAKGMPDVLVTYLPRSRSGISRTGFDQGEELAKAVAATGVYPSASLFVRDGYGEQKQLLAKERMTAIRKSLRLRRSVARNGLNGKTVILVDDVVTTGSTMAVATELVRRAGAVRVIGAAIAVTSDEEEKKQTD